MNRERSRKSVADKFLCGRWPSHEHLADIWILYRMCPEIWLFARVDLLYRHVRLLDPLRSDR
jgi:hypothetical protein